MKKDDLVVGSEWYFCDPEHVKPDDSIYKIDNINREAGDIYLSQLNPISLEWYKPFRQALRFIEGLPRTPHPIKATTIEDWI